MAHGRRRPRLWTLTKQQTPQRRHSYEIPSSHDWRVEHHDSDPRPKFDGKQQAEQRPQDDRRPEDVDCRYCSATLGQEPKHDQCSRYPDSERKLPLSATVTKVRI